MGTFQHDIAGPQRDAIHLPALAATTDEERVIWVAPFIARIVKIDIAFDEDVTGQAASFTLAINDNGVDGGETPAELVSKEWKSGVDSTKFVPESLYAPTAKDHVAANTVLTLDRTHDSTGLKTPAMYLYVEYEGD